MADDYKQYTSCCLPQQWRSLATYLVSATATLLAVAIVTIAVAGWCALFYLGVAAAAEAVAACSWWLNIRLVCLGGDRSAAGMLVAIEPAVGKSGYFNELDTDYSINLLLYPNLPGVSQAEAEISHPYGELIKNQQDIIDHIGFFEGYKATEEPRRSRTEQARYCTLSSKEPASTTSSSAPRSAWASTSPRSSPAPPFRHLGAFFSLVCWHCWHYLAWFLSHEVGAGDYGGPGDVKGAPSELHTNDPATSIGADLLYVQGTWVFDTFHTGWNEIHPIKRCTSMGTWDGAWPPDIPDRVKRLDDGFADARDPQTIARQAEPAYKWEIHPLIDGCGQYPGVHILPVKDPPLHDVPIIK